MNTHSWTGFFHYCEFRCFFASNPMVSIINPCIRWQHHCRICGNIFCGNCTKLTAVKAPDVPAEILTCLPCREAELKRQEKEVLRQRTYFMSFFSHSNPKESTFPTFVFVFVDCAICGCVWSCDSSPIHLLAAHEL